MFAKSSILPLSFGEKNFLNDTFLSGDLIFPDINIFIDKNIKSKYFIMITS